MSLLTTKNVKKGIWIKDPKHGISQIIHVHKSIAKYMDETPFTYKVYNGHLCHRSATLTGTEFKLYIIPSYKVYILKKLNLLKNFFK
jgi:hypothetical protein